MKNIFWPGINIIVFNPDEDEKSDKFINYIKSFSNELNIIHFHFRYGIGCIDSLSIDRITDNIKDKQSIYIYDARSKWSERGLKSNRVEICNQLNMVNLDAKRENTVLLLVIDAADKNYASLPYIEYINTVTIYSASTILISKENTDDNFELLKHREFKIHHEYNLETLLNRKDK